MSKRTIATSAIMNALKSPDSLASLREAALIKARSEAAIARQRHCIEMARLILGIKEGEGITRDKMKLLFEVSDEVATRLDRAEPETTQSGKT